MTREWLTREGMMKLEVLMRKKTERKDVVVWMWSFKKKRKQTQMCFKRLQGDTLQVDGKSNRGDEGGPTLVRSDSGFRV